MDAAEMKHHAGTSIALGVEEGSSLGLLRPFLLSGTTWRRFFLHAGGEFMDDRIPTVSASVTFYFLLAFFPALGAFVSLYGFLADISTAREHLAYLRGVLPRETLQFLGNEMIRVAGAHASRLSVALFSGAAVSLWSANSGVKALIGGLNIAYEQKKNAGFSR